MNNPAIYAAALLSFALLAVSVTAIADDEELSPSDHLQAAVQGICPVSGNKLGEHGAPIKVKVGKQTLFLCCPGCAEGKIDRQHWATIHANFARAQGKCPVMKNPLPRNSKWTIVEGRIVYVCCRPCTRKIEADPKTYLAQVDDYFAAWIRASQQREAAGRQADRR